MQARKNITVQAEKRITNSTCLFFGEMDGRWQDGALLGKDPAYGSLSLTLSVKDPISTVSFLSWKLAETEAGSRLLLQLYKTLEMTLF